MLQTLSEIILVYHNHIVTSHQNMKNHIKKQELIIENKYVHKTGQNTLQLQEEVLGCHEGGIVICS